MSYKTNSLVWQCTADIISDGILLLVPVSLFMTIQEKKLRYRLMVIFGTCIVTTIVSFVHAAYLFEAKKVPIVISAVIEVSLDVLKTCVR